MCVIPLALKETEVAEAAEVRSSTVTKILTVGRLSASERYKGVDTLIRALAELQVRGTNVALDVVGAGDDLGRCERLAVENGVQSFVRFHGRVDESTLQELYAGCDIFAMPSKGEGFGIVFLEAMRHGKPCIGGNHGGTPEVIDHGVTGYLVEHGEAAKLAQRLQALIKSPTLRARMGYEAREKVRRQYLFGSFRENWRRLLDRLASPKSASAAAAARWQRI